MNFNILPKLASIKVYFETQCLLCPEIKHKMNNYLNIIHRLKFVQVFQTRFENSLWATRTHTAMNVDSTLQFSHVLITLLAIWNLSASYLISKHKGSILWSSYFPKCVQQIIEVAKRCHRWCVITQIARQTVNINPLTLRTAYYSLPHLTDQPDELWSQSSLSQSVLSVNDLPPALHLFHTP